MVRDPRGDQSQELDYPTLPTVESESESEVPSDSESGSDSDDYDLGTMLFVADDPPQAPVDIAPPSPPPIAPPPLAHNVPPAARRSARATRGQHANPHHLPRSVVRH